MFPRPAPVPSKSALKVLYQLAYISTGTAVGVGTLCAEERRRRIQTVQQIADNAKRLRNSPRYAHGAAVLAEVDGEADVMQVSSGGWQPEVRRGRLRRRGEGSGEAAVRAPELPSVIAEEYGVFGEVEVRRGASPTLYGSTGAEAGASDGVGRVVDEESLATRERPTRIPSVPIRRIPHMEKKLRVGHVRDEPDIGISRNGSALSGDDDVVSISRAISQQKSEIESLDRECRRLMSHNKDALAFAVLAQVCGERRPRRIQDLVTELFDAAMLRGELSSAASLLLWSSRSNRNPTLYRGQLQRFIRACEDGQAHALLAEAFIRRLETPRLHAVARLVSAEALETLYTACFVGSALDVQRQFLSEALKNKKVAFSPEVKAIEVLWKTVRNLEVVEPRLTVLQQEAESRGDHETLRNLRQAMFEIYLQAGQHDKAIASIKQHGTSDVTMTDQTLMNSAALCARRREWASVNTILHVARDTQVRITGLANRSLTDVIERFSRHHPAPETWTFINRAVRDLDLRPDPKMILTVLQCFVSRHLLELIGPWLRLLRSREVHFELTPATAASLLARYYRDHRPGHVILMWQCRGLAQSAPGLQSERLKDLVLEAIGYDLRRAGRSDPGVQALVKERLRRLTEGKVSEGDIIPDPGYHRHGRVVFEDRGADGTLLAPVAYGSKGGSVVLWDSRREHSLADAHQGLNAGREDRTVEAAEPEEFRHALANGNDVLFEKQETASSSSAGDENTDAREDWGASYAQDFDANSASHTQDSDANSSSASDGIELSLSDLRDVYEQPPSADSLPVLKTSDSRSRWAVAEARMVYEMSLSNYEKVLHLYRSSRKTGGLPKSPMALEVAVEASLRLHQGDNSEATAMMTDARRAGMNVSCAMGPLIMHNLRNSTRAASRRDIDQISRTVIDYYRLNEANAWPVKNHVAITAADVLIRAGRPDAALQILNPLYNSDWTVDRPFDIVAMTVFLKAHLSLRSLPGIAWVVRTVLDQDLRIDAPFIQTLRLTRRWHLRSLGARPPNLTHRTDLTQSPEARALTLSWRQACDQRQADQRARTRKFGWKLVHLLANLSRPDSWHRPGAPLYLPTPVGKRNATRIVRPRRRCGVKGLRRERVDELA